MSSADHIVSKAIVIDQLLLGTRTDARGWLDTQLNMQIGYYSHFLVMQIMDKWIKTHQSTFSLKG